MKRLAVLSGGIWRLRDRVERALDATAVRYVWPLRQPEFDAVVGWGRKETAARAMALAQTAGKPYIALEDGFLRSVTPGAETPPLSLIVDHTGIYYDATRPSDLETAIARAATLPPGELARAETAFEQLHAARLSKYNDGRERTPAELGLDLRRDCVLVVDQTYNDASVRHGLADDASFARMLMAAISENPTAQIVVKTHPDVVAGRKRGYLGVLPPLGHVDRDRVRIVADAVVPWCLIDAAARVYVVTSQLGCEAMLAGKAVVCFGAPFYAGWGLTDDRCAIPRRTAKPSRAALMHAAYIDYPRYLCPYSGERIEIEQAIERLAFLRDRHAENDKPSVCYKVTLWKRKVIAPLLTGAAGRPRYARLQSRAIAKAARDGGQLVVWASRVKPRLERRALAAGVPLVRIEDGFIRSVGLGARYVRGASIAFDRLGIYFDGRRASGLEVMLETVDMSPELIARAGRLRAEIRRLGLTKYNVGAGVDLDRLLPGRPFVLVPGQVADDASIRSTISTTVDLASPEGPNEALLAAARARDADAFIVYKPHPDVEAGLRKGKLTETQAKRHADMVISDVSIVPLIERCQRVETLTSLTGFEALLRDKPVAVHGMPFYAGWGLTTDTTTCPRRTRMRTLDELIAAALILYPRYIDHASLLPCPVEVVLENLANARKRAKGD